MLTIDDLQTGTVIRFVPDSRGIRWFASGMVQYLDHVCTVNHVDNNFFTTFESGAYVWPIESVAYIIDGESDQEMHTADEDEIASLLFGKG